MTNTHPGKQIHRSIIYNIGPFHNTVVSELRIGIKRNIGHNDHSRTGIFYGFDTALHQTIRVQRFTSFIVLQIGLGIATLMTGVDLHVAIAHQAVAVLLLGSLLWAAHSLTAPKGIIIPH